MAKRITKKKTTKKIHQKQKKYWLFRWQILFLVLALTLFGTGFYLKEKIVFYYAMYFNKFQHKKLSNSEFEEQRINRIIGDYADKTFGIDLSHYQLKEDVKWDSLSIGNRSIPIKFVVLRGTMGNKSTDRHFEEFWQLAKKHELIRGAYHFYRTDEDPVTQANNFLANVKLEEGDLPPILDIEKIPKQKSNEKLINDLKIWCRIIEKIYGTKPIIYTYYHYYKNFLRGEFDDYPLWLANYNDVPTPSLNDNWDFWQFTENGIVYGISTKVDINVFNGNLQSLKKMTLD
jgi:lysozyme